MSRNKLAWMMVLWLAIASTALSAPMSLGDVGMISVKAEGAMGNGVADDTAAINAAIQKARKAGKVLLFPEGTYLVSDTIQAIIPGEVTGEHQNGSPKVGGDTGDHPVALVGSTGGAKPVIKLKNSSAGFDRATSPKPVLYFQLFADEDDDGIFDPGEPSASANFFRCGIRNMKVEVGAGNPGAVALDFDGSQGCFVENFEADLTAGGYCGLSALIGQKGVLGNIKISGGQYGIKPGPTKYPAMNGIELINQTEAAIYQGGQQALQITGFRIVKAQAPAIITPKSNSDSAGHISLVDGTIEFSGATGGYAVDNTGGRTVVMRNVYVHRASQIVKSGSLPAIQGTADGWTKVEEYVAPCAGIGRNLVDGSTNTTEYKTIATGYNGTVPQDLVSRHLWNPADFPSADVILSKANAGDPDYAVVPISLRNGWDENPKKNESGGDISPDDPDATATIQQLIDNHRFVLIPKGKFMVSKPVELRENTVLQGINASLSALHTHIKWQPTSADYNRDADGDGFIDGDTAVIRTPDSATARPKMAWLNATFGTRDNHDWHTAFLWRSGEQSLIKSVDCKARKDVMDGGNPRADMIYSGNAGGRHYAVGAGNYCKTDHAQHRRVLVKKAPGSEAALCFYNLNAEDNLRKPQIAIQDSRNVVVYGSKNEDEPLIEWLNCDNCAHFGANGNCSIRFGKSGTPDADCNNVYAAGFGPKKPKGKALEEFFAGKASSVPKANPLGVFKRGNCDFSLFAIPADARASVSPDRFSAYHAAGESKDGLLLLSQDHWRHLGDSFLACLQRVSRFQFLEQGTGLNVDQAI